MNDRTRLLHGIDIIEIERIKAAVERWGKRFLKRFFTPDELDYSFGYKNPYPRLAVRFAAKEAGSKALSIIMPCYISNFEVVGGNNNPPYIKLLKAPYCRGHLSISHTHSLAVASVIFEWRQNEDIDA